MTKGPRKTHEFCWINLMTPEAAQARAFFSKLFGWTYGPMPGVPGGAIIEVEGLAAGAMMDLAAAQLPPGVPPSIGAMVRVDDAEAALARCVALGGSGGPVHDALENGRMAHCADPMGASFGLWQPKKELGFEADSRAHGAPTWFETLTTDAERAVSFYCALFGWVPNAQPMPGGDYTLLELGGVAVAGAMALRPNMGPAPAHWAVSFAVKNADETMRLGLELGASQCMGVHALEGVGRFGMMRSPQGVPLHIIQWAQ